MKILLENFVSSDAIVEMVGDKLNFTFIIDEKPFLQVSWRDMEKAIQLLRAQNDGTSVTIHNAEHRPALKK